MHGRSNAAGLRHGLLEPVPQGVRHASGTLGADAACGLTPRSDRGLQYAADAFRPVMSCLMSNTANGWASRIRLLESAQYKAASRVLDKR